MGHIRGNLITLMFLMLDKSMSGYYPKISKLGGLPNYTHKTRKQVALGKMLKNSECWSAGMIVYNDVAQNPEQQSRKKHSKDKNSLPDESNILVRTAEVLRQVEGTELEKNSWIVSSTFTNYSLAKKR